MSAFDFHDDPDLPSLGEGSGARHVDEAVERAMPGLLDMLDDQGAAATLRHALSIGVRLGSTEAIATLIEYGLRY
jgi:hypothetical protein